MYQKTVLDNDIKIISEKLEHFRSISLGIWVGVGSRDEGEEESGISHFIEHMIFKGTRNRNSYQIAKELDLIGGFSNAFTGKEYTCFHSKVLDRHFSSLADILSDIFLNSIFDFKEIDREKMVILQEIGMMDDTPDEFIHEIFSRLFWLSHPLGRSILGTNESVSRINQKTILNYMERFYTPNRIIISAAGNIEHSELVDFFKPLFDRLKKGPKIPPSGTPKTTPGISSRFKPLEQVHICLGGKAPDLKDDKRYASAILNTILGGNMSSRLFQEIREKRGLAYSVYSFLTTYYDTGLLGVYMGTDSKNVNTALSVISDEIAKIQKGDVSPSDIIEAREHLVGGILLGAESTDSRMMRLAKNEFFFNRYIDYDEVVEDLEKVTVDEVISCARDAFKSDSITLATLGPIKEDELDMKSLRFD